MEKTTYTGIEALEVCRRYGTEIHHELLSELAKSRFELTNHKGDKIAWIVNERTHNRQALYLSLFRTHTAEETRLFLNYLDFRYEFVVGNLEELETILNSLTPAPNQKKNELSIFSKDELNELDSLLKGLFKLEYQNTQKTCRVWQFATKDDDVKLRAWVYFDGRVKFELRDVSEIEWIKDQSIRIYLQPTTFKDVLNIIYHRQTVREITPFITQ